MLQSRVHQIMLYISKFRYLSPLNNSLGCNMCLREWQKTKSTQSYVPKVRDRLRAMREQKGRIHKRIRSLFIQDAMSEPVVTVLLHFALVNEFRFIIFRHHHHLRPPFRQLHHLLSALHLDFGMALRWMYWVVSPLEHRSNRMVESQNVLIKRIKYSLDSLGHKLITHCSVSWQSSSGADGARKRYRATPKDGIDKRENESEKPNPWTGTTSERLKRCWIKKKRKRERERTEEAPTTVDSNK